MSFDLKVGDFPPDLLSVDTIVARDRRRDRPQPRQHRRAACHPRLNGVTTRGAGERATDGGSPASASRPSPMRCGARRGPRHAGLRHGPRRRSTAPRRRSATPSPTRGCASTRSRPTTSRRSSRRSPRAGSAPTSSRAASGRSPGAPASPNERITLEGVGKTDADLRAAVRAAATGSPLLWVALESADEAEVVTRMARRAGLGRGDRPALDVLVRLNPDVTPETHRRARRRRRGVEVRDDRDRGDRRRRVDHVARRRRRPAARHPPARRIAAARGRRLAGCRPARSRRRRAAPRRARRTSTRSTSVAGSRSCRSTSPVPAPERFARELPALLDAVPADRRPSRLAIEPGRALVARAGWLVARVLHVRDRGGRQVVIDAGMTELIRPALYGARHPIVALTSAGRAIDADAALAARTDPRRWADLRIDRRPRHPRPAATPPRRPRRDRRRRRLRRLARPRPTTAVRARRRSSSRPTGRLRLVRRARS